MQRAPTMIDLLVAGAPRSWTRSAFDGGARPRLHRTGPARPPPRPDDPRATLARRPEARRMRCRCPTGGGPCDADGSIVAARDRGDRGWSAPSWCHRAGRAATGCFADGNTLERRLMRGHLDATARSTPSGSAPPGPVTPADTSSSLGRPRPAPRGCGCHAGPVQPLLAPERRSSDRAGPDRRGRRQGGRGQAARGRVGPTLRVLHDASRRAPADGHRRHGPAAARRRGHVRVRRRPVDDVRNRLRLREGPRTVVFSRAFPRQRTSVRRRASLVPGARLVLREDVVPDATRARQPTSPASRSSGTTACCRDAAASCSIRDVRDATTPDGGQRSRASAGARSARPARCRRRRDARSDPRAAARPSPPRGSRRVVRARVRADDVGAERVERVGHERPDGLGREPASLERRRHRVPDLHTPGSPSAGLMPVADEPPLAILQRELDPAPAPRRPRRHLLDVGPHPSGSVRSHPC